ncbi:helix-turn-helix domain-containing protein, partial [Marinomonas agarivorans]
MGQITFKNIETSKSVTFDVSLKILKTTGREIFLQDAAVYVLIHKLFTQHTSLVRYSDIGNIVRDQKSTFHMEDSPDSIIANKYVFKLRAVLKSILIEDFIVTIRGLGYKVSNKWQPILESNRDVQTKNAFLKEITSIIDDCITYSDSVDLIQEKSGLSFIKPDQTIVLNHFRRMNDLYHMFLSKYSAPGNGAELLELREKIIK